MRSWAPPRLPSLAPRFGLADRPAVYDSSRARVVPTAPEGAARLYVCGITPYDATHLGHAATYVAFDLLVRAWRDAGDEVIYVQNVTDVDDPLLERANNTGEDWQALAERQTELFRTDMAALRVIPPTDYVGAVEAIPLIDRLIAQLGRREALYELDGDWYFPVHSDPAFGAVSGLGPAEMIRLFQEGGGDPQRPGKRDPLDCLVWQRQRTGEPGWESELGTGRPGWHIECSAIALEYLGMSFDVQGGGSDLVFPHHEMCAAGAEVATGKAPFAKAYVHAGMVGLAGEKMSKSRGNLVFVSALLERGVDPMAIRLALLANHYRSDWEWEDDLLEQAGARLARWRRAVAAGSGPPAAELVAEVRAALSDDLDTAAALDAVDRWAAGAESGQGSDPGAGDAVRQLCDARLGVLL
jgi:L-cysteine:1D-myo-inositol 2-amino-2-deoxy-alpha-D-glucopyranoside ligase